MFGLRSLSPLLLTCALAVSGCKTSEEDVPPPSNQMVQAEIARRIAEIRYMHGQELLSNLNALAKRGEDAAPQLREAVASEDWLTRMGVAYVFGIMGDRRNMAWLEPLLEDPVAEVRYEAASSLLDLGNPLGFAPLVQGLEDADVRVRYKSIQSLRRHVPQDFGYVHDAPVAERHEAVLRWRRWLEESRSAAGG